MSKAPAPMPQKIHSYKAYNEGEQLVGTQAEATLPSLEAQTATLSGPGILGEIEVPNIGHFGSIASEIKFRTLSSGAAKLMEPGPHLITFRANQESYDSANGVIRHRPLKVVMRGWNKSTALGTLNQSNPTETTVTLEIFYIKVTEDTYVYLELDKYNEVYIVNGVDQMAQILANT